MAASVNRNKFLDFLSKPWILETLVFFLVLWQESIRLSARTSCRKLALGKQLQDFYYFYFGDFVNGYVIAFLIDALCDVIIFKSKPVEKKNYSLLGFKINKKSNSFLVTLLTVLIVIVYELGFISYSTTSDLNDVPAGVLGAFLYFAVRVYSINICSKNRN